jgi:nucleoside-diphosphate-sugar epimerase
MKALVTGASGAIGTVLLEELVKKGYETRCLFEPQLDASRAQQLGSQIVRGNLLDPSTLKGIAEGVEVVFHLAAKVGDWGPRSAFYAVGVDGTKNLLDECTHVKRFIYFSSIVGLGFGRDMQGLDEDAVPIKFGTSYSDCKIDAETLVRTYCNNHNIPYTIIRPANVIGPNSVNVKDVVEALLKVPVPLVGGGKAPGAFVYITNLVDGVISAAESEKAIGKTYHLKDDYDITWGEYIKILGSWIGKKPVGSIPFKLAWWLGYVTEILFSPFKLRPPLTRTAAALMGQNNDVDNSRAKRDLGWNSKVPLDVALREIEQWVKDTYKR